MNIELRKITIREVTEGYVNDNENGVVGYNGRLDIRPCYQREFVYEDEQRNEVIRTINKGLPLNVIYWCKTGEDTYEVMDGQQRTISFSSYVDGDFSVDGKYFYNLSPNEKNKILDYELFVYVCDGTDSEKLDWFKIINIAGKELSCQELRNAVYSGSWVTDAKRLFSKSGCAAENLAANYLKGERKRQTYLETALAWIANAKGMKKIEEYMSLHQHDGNAQELWRYFRDVIEWVEAIFPKYRSQMKGLPWGCFYNEHGTRTDINGDEMEKEVHRLMKDGDVQSKAGIYRYLLTKDEKYLNIRAFDDNIASTVYERQGGICPRCNKKFPIEKMEADHITPWSEGGKTAIENCQMLCRECNRRKGAR